MRAAIILELTGGAAHKRTTQPDKHIASTVRRWSVGGEPPDRRAGGSSPGAGVNKKHPGADGTSRAGVCGFNRAPARAQLPDWAVGVSGVLVGVGVRVGQPVRHGPRKGPSSTSSPIGVS